MLSLALLSTTNPLSDYISDDVWASVLSDSNIKTAYESFGWAKKSALKYYVGGGNISNMLDEVADFLYIDNTMFDYIKAIWGFVLPAGICLFVLYFLMNLCQDITSRIHERGLDEKYWIMMFIKLVIAMIFFQYGIHIVVAIIDIGNSWIKSAVETSIFSSVSSGDSASVSYVQALIWTLYSMDFTEALLQNIFGFLANIISILPLVAVLLQAITRQLTIIIQGGLTPLSFADIYENGTKSVAFNYLKRFAVSMLHGLIIVWVLQLVSGLSINREIVYITYKGVTKAGYDLTNILAYIKTLLYMFGAAGAVSAGKQILNYVFGVS